MNNALFLGKVLRKSMQYFFSLLKNNANEMLYAVSIKAFDIF